MLREQLLKYPEKNLQERVHEHKTKNAKEVIDLVESYQVAHKVAIVADGRKGVNDHYSAGQVKGKQGYVNTQGKTKQNSHSEKNFFKQTCKIYQKRLSIAETEYRDTSQTKKGGKVNLCFQNKDLSNL